MKSYQNMLLDSYSSLASSHILTWWLGCPITSSAQYLGSTTILRRWLDAHAFTYYVFLTFFFVLGSLDPKDALQQAAASSLVESLGFKAPGPLFGTCCRKVSWCVTSWTSHPDLYTADRFWRFWWWANKRFFCFFLRGSVEHERFKPWGKCFMCLPM